MKEFDDYQKEAELKWKGTAEYSEYREKSKNYSTEKWKEINCGLESIFKEFFDCYKNGLKANSTLTQSLVLKLQQYITKHYYTCTDYILIQLADMYVADERFKNNIDKHGVGTAEYVRDAIKCKL